MKRTLLPFVLLLSLQADMGEYTLQKKDLAKEKYFIKIAAYKDIKNAQKMQLITDFSTKIIYMKSYHSLISDEFQSKDEAGSALKKIKESYKDAYIIKLYKNQKEVKPLLASIPIKPIKIVKQSNIHQDAISLYNDKKYEEALMAFDMILIDTPNDTDAKIYYAKTLYKLSFFDEAKKEFKSLLNKSLDANSKKNIKTYLINIDKKQKKNFFTAIASIGIGYDDNINLTTNAKTTQYGPYSLINDTNKTDSTYGLASIFLSHQYIGKFFNLHTMLYSYNEFAHVAKDSDLNFLDIASSINKSYGNFLVSIPVGFNTSYLNGDDIGYNIYTNPTFTYAINKELKTVIQASFLDNTTKFTKNRDYRAVGGGLGIRHNKKKFHSVLGLNFQKFTAKKDLRFDINKDMISYFGFSKYYILKSFYVGANISFKNDNYRDLDEVMGYKRKDKTLRYGLSSGKNITKNIQLNLTYSHIINDSNINTYTYEKNSYAVECKYKF